MPPLTIENASALVAGGGVSAQKESHVIAQKPAQAPQTLKVEVLRAFYFEGKVQAKGSEPTLPRVFALEMAAAHKVRVVVEEPAKAEPTVSPSAETQARSEPVRKESRNAR